MRTTLRKSVTGLLALGLTLTLAACGGGDDSGAAADQLGSTVGIAMPTKVSTRWIEDGDSMTQQFKALGYEVDLQYADNDVKTQVAQVKAMIERGDKAVVIAAVDGGSLAGVLQTAKDKGIPVIAYDRLIRGTAQVDYYASFDNEQVGILQAQYIVRSLGLDTGAAGPFTIEMFAGSPDDNNANMFFDGSMTVLQPYISAGKLVVRSGQTSFADIATLRWDGDRAKARMATVLGSAYGDTRLDAVLSPYDGMSRGIIDALNADGYGTAEKKLPVVTGQDAELDSVKSILAGKQGMTVFKDTRELAKVAVQLGRSLLRGTAPATTDEATENGVKDVPTYLLPPVSVDRANAKTVLVGTGYYEAAEL